jgi:hypothetical protein
MFADRKPKETALLVFAALAMLALASSPFMDHWLRDPAAARSSELPLSFPHLKHRDVSCPTCHHNLKDKTATEGLPCIHCHKSDNAKLKRGVEGEFHDFCKGCHALQARLGNQHGPVRDCGGCHIDANDDGRLP